MPDKELIISTNNVKDIIFKDFTDVSYGIGKDKPFYRYTSVSISSDIHIEYNEYITKLISDIGDTYYTVHEIYDMLIKYFSKFSQLNIQTKPDNISTGNYINDYGKLSSSINRSNYVLSINGDNIYYTSDSRGKRLLINVAYMIYNRCMDIFDRLKRLLNVHYPDTVSIKSDMGDIMDNVVTDEPVNNVSEDTATVNISTVSYIDLFKEVMSKTSDKYLAALKNYIIADWLNNYRRLVFNLQWLINSHATITGEVLNIFKLYRTFTEWYEDKLRKFNCMLFTECTKGIPGELNSIMETTDNGRLATNNLRYEFREYVGLPIDLAIDDAYEYSIKNYNTLEAE